MWNEVWEMSMALLMGTARCRCQQVVCEVVVVFTTLFGVVLVRMAGPRGFRRKAGAFHLS